MVLHNEFYDGYIVAATHYLLDMPGPLKDTMRDEIHVKIGKTSALDKVARAQPIFNRFGQ